MRIAWLLGWAVPTAWFADVVAALIPAATHHYAPATAAALAQLEAAGPFDRVVGYSLGSLLLLREPARASRLGVVTLLAPIFAFSAEEKLGGRVARTQVRHLARWLAREPTAALGDFYARAGLGASMTGPTDVTAAELQWGLERLAHDRVEPPLPTGWDAWCGDRDPLLDARQLQACEPRVRAVPGATHHPAGLIAAALGAPRERATLNTSDPIGGPSGDAR